MDVLIFIMSVKPGFPPDVANHYGQRLIAGIVHIFKQLGEKGVEIEKHFMLPAARLQASNYVES